MLNRAGVPHSRPEPVDAFERFRNRAPVDLQVYDAILPRVDVKHAWGNALPHRAHLKVFDHADNPRVVLTGEHSRDAGAVIQIHDGADRVLRHRDAELRERCFVYDDGLGRGPNVVCRRLVGSEVVGERSPRDDVDAVQLEEADPDPHGTNDEPFTPVVLNWSHGARARLRHVARAGGAFDAR